MSRLLTLLLFSFLLGVKIFAYESLLVKSQNVTVVDIKWKATQKLEDPLSLINDNQFLSLEKHAQAKGVDRNYYNYRLHLVVEQASTKLYIQSIYSKGESCRLSLFKQTATKTTLYSQTKFIKDAPIELANTAFNGIAILQCQSQGLRVVGVKIASDLVLKLDATQDSLYIYMFTGLLIGLVLYNIFLLIIIRDIIYLYYIINSSAIYSINYFNHYGGNIEFITQLSLLHLLIIAALLSSALFIDTYLNLKRHHVKLRKLLWVLVLFSIVVHLIEIYTPNVILSPLSALIVLLYIFFLTLFSYTKGYKPALFIIIAKGGSLLSFFLGILIMLGGFYHYTVLAKYILLAGLSWDMIMLSLALTYRIKTLQLENTKVEQQLLIQAKFSSIGEITGNISHQWREPLGGLGAILAKSKARLLYAQPNKEELLESINLCNEIVQHLSDTVDVFREFYVIKKDEVSFDLNKAIIDTIKLIKDLYKIDNINIIYHPKKAYFIKGKSNEFSQILLSIFHNSKEMINIREIKSGQIAITLTQKNDEISLSICDNAGGIEVQPVEDIFKAHLTQKKRSSGIGLYLVKIIVEEKLKGTITAYNTHEGACFALKVKC